MESKRENLISIEHARKVLNKYGKTYTDEQIIRIREVLYKLGKLDYILFKELIKNGRNKATQPETEDRK